MGLIYIPELYLAIIIANNLQISTYISNSNYRIGNELEIGNFRTDLPHAVPTEDDGNAEDEGPSTSLAGTIISDPATWRNLSSMHKENIVLTGPSSNPSSFP